MHSSAISAIKVNKCLAWAICIVALGGPASASSHAKSQEQFIISFWGGPRSDRDPDLTYAEVAACNFTHVMPPIDFIHAMPWIGLTGDKTYSVAKNRAILDACAKYGLKAVLYDYRIQPVMRESVDAPDFAAHLEAAAAAVTQDYKDHPALEGYFILDEPGAKQFGVISAVHKCLATKDPSCLPYVNLFPNYAPVDALGTPTYEEYVDKFCEQVKPRLLSYDSYVVMADANPDQPTLTEGYFQNMAAIRKAALKYRVPWLLIFLTAPHGPYRNPTETDLRWQINMALAHGAKGIAYFQYWTANDSTIDPPFRNGIITWDGQRTEHFDQAKRINAEMKILGPTFMKLTSTGVYRTSIITPRGTESESGLPVQIAHDAPVVVGTFEHADGSTWVMVVNREFRRSTRVELVCSRSATEIAEMSGKTGNLTALKLDEKRAARIELDPGAACLLKVMQSSARKLNGSKKLLSH